MLQREMSSDLSSNLNGAAFFLASDISGNPRETSESKRDLADHVNWTSPNVQLAVKIEGLQTSKLSSSVTWNTGHGDSVMFTNADLIKAVNLSSQEKLAVACISYKNLGKYMQDDRGLGGSNYPVNSHLISLSVRKLGSPVTIQRNVQLDRPVTLQFQHSNKRHAVYMQNRCAFWNDRSWSHEGCESKFSNTTHTTCSCKHLTTFSVLSTNESEIPGFPPIIPLPEVAQPRFVYLMIVRGGLIISLTLLLFVAVSLTVYR